MYAVRGELRGIDILRHAHEDLVRGHERKPALRRDFADDLVELGKEGAEALLVPHLQGIWLDEKEFCARRHDGVYKIGIVGAEGIGRDLFPAREAAPDVVDAHLEHDIIGLFVHDVLLNARAQLRRALSAHTAVEEAELGVGIEQAQLARRDLDVADAEVGIVHVVASRFGDGITEKDDLGAGDFGLAHALPPNFSSYAWMHFLMISTASSRCAISLTVVFLCSKDLYTSKKCIISSKICLGSSWIS